MAEPLELVFVQDFATKTCRNPQESARKVQLLAFVEENGHPKSGPCHPLP